MFSGYEFLITLSLSHSQSVVELIKTHFRQKSSAPEPPLIPTFPVPSHEEPRCSCFVESEAAGVSPVKLVNLHANISARLSSILVNSFQ